MTLSITYVLTGTGWASCTIETVDTKVTLTASYLSDALGSLVVSGIAVLSGFDTCSFGFDEEPGEYRWVITAVPHMIQIHVLEFAELWGWRPNSQGKLLLTFKCARLVFAKAVHAAALAVLEQHGIDGYEEQWVHAKFPERQVALLGALIADWENA
ncbi:hypothetical protein [Nitrosospira multiformis]|uniref:Uncharacterized protein n=1 Tax=Nitrosospira multiformis TaxID=1231 RepID=A0A1I7HMF4_9PROT|nr:hypothetical protein [Nitrosospira multiformis]SFU61616.1 hypothetical protein SAMN05216417_11065 [Nitrosospira multiformis]